MEKGPLKYINTNYGFPVVTSQEKKLLFNRLTGIKSMEDGRFDVSYATEVCHEFQAEAVACHENEKYGKKYSKIKFKQQDLNFK